MTVERSRHDLAWRRQGSLRSAALVENVGATLCTQRRQEQVSASVQMPASGIGQWREPRGVRRDVKAAGDDRVGVRRNSSLEAVFAVPS